MSDCTKNVRCPACGQMVALEARNNKAYASLLYGWNYEGPYYVYPQHKRGYRWKEGKGYTRERSCEKSGTVLGTVPRSENETALMARRPVR